ncbi:MAG: hypothetical protein Q4D65_01175 [Peptostreptococcaceae bacterium]|nr:hypothetical protein [Peptostreptococcaceae bacterium]
MKNQICAFKKFERFVRNIVFHEAPVRIVRPGLNFYELTHWDFCDKAD